MDAAIEQRTALDYDPTTRSLFPDFYNRFRDWRDQVNRDLHIEAVFSYHGLVQGLQASNFSEFGGAGEVGAQARWLLFGSHYHRPVYLALGLRNRHAYTDTAPGRLTADTGLLWKTADGFSNAGFQVPELYVSQERANSRLTLRYGQFSINNFFDSNSLRSGKRAFLNQIFSANPAVGFPDYGAGGTLQWKDEDNWDLSAGISNIQEKDQRRDVNLSFSSRALFAVLQGGYTFKDDQGRETRVQAMVWDSEDNGEDEPTTGAGFSLTVERAGKRSGERYLLRLAAAEGEATLVDRLLVLAWGRSVGRYNYLGIGAGLGRSARDRGMYQGVGEIFFRWQLTKELIVSPDLQLILGHDLDNSRDLVVVTGLRCSLTF